MTDHETIRVLIGGRVLGGIEDVDLRRLERHLPACRACRGELAELEGLPSLLRRAQSRRLQPPADLRSRVLRDAVGAPQPDRRRGPRLVTAAALAVLLAAGAIVVPQVLTRSSSAAVTVFLHPVGTASDPYAGAFGSARLVQGDGVIEIALELEGLPALPEPGTYAVWMVHDDGRVAAGSLRPSPDGRVDASLTAAGQLSRYHGIGVTAEPDDRDPSRNGAAVVLGDLPAP